MRRCNAGPYEGDKKYIFASYCHKDRDVVYPIIEHMAKDGYRIWYDEGINPGTDWPEIIAEHLDKCSVCISFITENSIESHNCRREINFALLKKKPFISAFLEEVQLSVGMEMQLSSTQSVFRYKYDEFKDFLSKFYKGEDMALCKGEPMLDIIISDSDYVESEEKPKKQIKYVFSLIRNNTGEKIIIDKNNFKIGRKKELCDFYLGDNRSISRVHAVINISEDKCYIFDNNSLNGIKINGEKITPMVNTEIINDYEIRMGSERFTVLIEEGEV